MQIWAGLWRQRPRNDLDEYLSEVDGHLFCVSKSDRRCLLRDLKAHIKELTTDEANRGRYNGLYIINKTDLYEEIGDPRQIATMYISSVVKQPSTMMRAFIWFMSVFFICGGLIGLDRLFIGMELEDAERYWYLSSGLFLISTAVLVFFLAVLSGLHFERFYYVGPYLIFVFFLFSLPISVYLSNGIVSLWHDTLAQGLFQRYFWLFVLDFIILALMGFYLSLTHWRVYQPKRAQTI